MRPNIERGKWNPANEAEADGAQQATQYNKDKDAALRGEQRAKYHVRDQDAKDQRAVANAYDRQLSESKNKNKKKENKKKRK